MDEAQKREKVIKGLEWITVLFKNYERHAIDDPEMQALYDAIALLKAQEPVKPLKIAVDHVRKEPVVFSYECPVCMCGLQRHWVACPICGTGVKFE